MYFMFQAGLDKYFHERYETWQFNVADTTFSLTRLKREDEFNITYSLQPGSSWTFLDGKCRLVGNDWVLDPDSIHMRIHDSYLIGFRTMSDTVKMIKDER